MAKTTLRLMEDACELAGLADEFEELLNENQRLREALVTVWEWLGSDAVHVDDESMRVDRIVRKALENAT